MKPTGPDKWRRQNLRPTEMLAVANLTTLARQSGLSFRDFLASMRDIDQMYRYEQMVFPFYWTTFQMTVKWERARNDFPPLFSTAFGELGRYL